MTDSSSPSTDSIAETFAEAAASLTAEGGRLAYGIFGQDVVTLNGDVPYRVASMSKSFTAAVIGGLATGIITTVDSQQLDLDAPLSTIVPALADTSVAGLTCRQSLTMSTGMTKDDPWADRMESMSQAEFLDYLHQDLTAISPPNAGFEYSNLNYTLLGLVAETVTGRSFTDLATAEVLAPFGLGRTGFDYRDFPDLEPGLRIDRHGTAHQTELTTPGAFSPIGGVISTVNDIHIWMRAHLDAWTSSPEYGVATSVATGVASQPEGWPRVLRDNQQAQRIIGLESSDRHVESVHYGFGLQYRLDSRFGRVLCHSGGYPGYGSHMRWFPDLDLGLVVFGNTTYYPAESLVQKALDSAEITRASTSAPVAYFAPTPDQSATVLAAAGLVVEWDEETAEELFAVNMDLDEPRTERRSRYSDWCVHHRIGADAPLELVMTTPLLGTVSIVGAPAEAMITVRLDHLGGVQSIKLSTLD